MSLIEKSVSSQLQVANDRMAELERELADLEKRNGVLSADNFTYVTLNEKLRDENANLKEQLKQNLNQRECYQRGYAAGLKDAKELTPASDD